MEAKLSEYDLNVTVTQVMKYAENYAGAETLFITGQIYKMDQFIRNVYDAAETISGDWDVETFEDGSFVISFIGNIGDGQTILDSKICGEITVNKGGVDIIFDKIQEG